MNRLDTVLINDMSGSFVIQGLQYDIAAQGDTIEAAEQAFEYAVAAEIGYLKAKGLSLADLPAAPKCYWKLQ